MGPAPLAVAAILVAGPALAMTEREYQPLVCPGMELEHVLPDGARVDCLSETHAYEVDFSSKWAEALGQALFYAAETGLQPGIILICRSAQATCLAHMMRLHRTIVRWDLRVIVLLWGGHDG